MLAIEVFVLAPPPPSFHARSGTHLPGSTILISGFVTERTAYPTLFGACARGNDSLHLADVDDGGDTGYFVAWLGNAVHMHIICTGGLPKSLMLASEQNLL